MKVPFLPASLLGYLFSDMVRVVDCHAGVLGSNPGGPKDFSPWNYYATISDVRCGLVDWLAFYLTRRLELVDELF